MTVVVLCLGGSMEPCSGGSIAPGPGGQNRAGGGGSTGLPSNSSMGLGGVTTAMSIVVQGPQILQQAMLPNFC